MCVCPILFHLLLCFRQFVIRTKIDYTRALFSRLYLYHVYFFIHWWQRKTTPFLWILYTRRWCVSSPNVFSYFQIMAHTKHGPRCVDSYQRHKQWIRNDPVRGSCEVIDVSLKVSRVLGHLWLWPFESWSALPCQCPNVDSVYGYSNKLLKLLLT